jgi:hypothetical protein
MKRKENKITVGSICSASLRRLKAKFLFHEPSDRGHLDEENTRRHLTARHAP